MRPTQTNGIFQRSCLSPHQAAANACGLTSMETTRRHIQSLTNVQASRRKCNGFLFGLNFGLASLGRQTT